MSMEVVKEAHKLVKNPTHNAIPYQSPPKAISGSGKLYSSLNPYRKSPIKYLLNHQTTTPKLTVS